MSKTPFFKKKYLSRKAVSILIGVSVTALQNWYKYPEMCQEGFPKAIKLSQRVYRYDTQEVLDFMTKTGRRNPELEKEILSIKKHEAEAQSKNIDAVPRETQAESIPYAQLNLSEPIVNINLPPVQDISNSKDFFSISQLNKEEREEEISD